MTVQTFRHLIPHTYFSPATSLGSSSNLIDAAGEKVGCLFQAPKTGNISHIGWATATVTTGDTVDVRVETISASVPSGTLWSTTTNGAQVVTNGNDDVMFETALTSVAAVTMGQALAVVIANGGGGGNMNIKSTPASSSAIWAFPKAILYTASWGTTTLMPCVYVKYDDGAIVPISPLFSPVITGTALSESVSTSTTPDEVGNIFQVPFPTKISGAILNIDPDDEAFEVILYDSNGTTVLASVSTDGDITQGLTSAGQGATVLLFSSAVDILANTNYRVVWKPGTTTSKAIAVFTSTAAALDATPMGSDCHKTSRTDAGAWSQDTTKQVLIYPIFSGFDDGASAGGMIVHPGMNGGMRG